MKLRHLLSILLVSFSLIGFFACTEENEEILPEIPESNEYYFTGDGGGEDMG